MLEERRGPGERKAVKITTSANKITRLLQFVLKERKEKYMFYVSSVILEGQYTQYTVQTLQTKAVSMQVKTRPRCMSSLRPARITAEIRAHGVF